MTLLILSWGNSILLIQIYYKFSEECLILFKCLYSDMHGKLLCDMMHTKCKCVQYHCLKSLGHWTLIILWYLSWVTVWGKWLLGPKDHINLKLQTIHMIYKTERKTNIEWQSCWCRFAEWYLGLVREDRTNIISNWQLDVEYSPHNPTVPVLQIKLCTFRSHDLEWVKYRGL